MEIALLLLKVGNFTEKCYSKMHVVKFSCAFSLMEGYVECSQTCF